LFLAERERPGKTERYGGIARYQFFRPIRRAVLEKVWAMMRSGKVPLFMKYGELPVGRST
jgi:hypothetical protein